MNINFGTNVMGTLTSAGDEQIYTFRAESGDRVTLSLGEKTSRLEPEIELYAPNGQLVDSVWSGRNAFLDAAALPQSGQYRIVIKDFGGDDTGSYSFNLQRTNNPENATAIAPGENVSGTLSTITSMETFTFDGSAGDRFALSLGEKTSGLEPEIRIYDPQGQLVTSKWSGNNTFIETEALSQNGQYTVLLRDFGGDDAGDYSFNLQRTNNPENATAIESGKSYSGQLGTITELDTFTFNGSVGDDITLSLKETSSRLEPEIRVYDPDGLLVKTIWNGVEASLSVNNLSKSGQYTALVRDFGGDDIGNYTLSALGNFGNTESMPSPPPSTQPAIINLSELNNQSGFVFTGENNFGTLGSSVSHIGDVNGDSIDDIIVGAPNSLSFASNNSEEAAYVIFGNANGRFPKMPSDLNGRNGFTISGIQALDDIGRSVSHAGDFNGDGLSDFIIGAPLASPGEKRAGQSYVVYGQKSRFNSVLELSDLLPENGGNGRQGFVLNGIDEDDFSGFSVSGVGDVNGDGKYDIVIKANSADPNGENRAGESYVVFGRSTDGKPIFELSDLQPENGGNGRQGFILNGINALDSANMGHSVSEAGDVNNDGIGDLIVSAYVADPNGKFNAGQSYVLYGNRSRFNATFNLSDLLPENGGNGRRGFVLNGVNRGDHAGISVSSAGDFNGDGIDDLIIGADNTNSALSDSGESYIVYGRTGGLSPVVELSSLLPRQGGDGSKGLVLSGIDQGDISGFSVSGAGDINYDCFDDVIVGAPAGDPNGNNGAGESYVIYGSATSSEPVLQLDELDGRNGFTINGINSGDGLGRSVSRAGDVNGDGVDDVILGARGAEPNDKGQSYVIYGQRNGQSANQAPTLTVRDTLTIKENKKIVVNVNATDDSDTEGNGLTYRLTDGEDQSRFQINRKSGALRFKTAPDFEQPSDANTNNDYKVEVSVTDSGGLSDLKQLNIRVTNVSEGPPSGNLRLIGTNARDTLTGMAGNDILIGKGGSDRLTGNGGRDRFIFESLNDRIDQITDFEVGRDKIVLKDIFASVGVNGFSQAISQGYLDTITFGQGNSRLQIDPDGTDGPLSRRTLANVLAVSESELSQSKNFVI